MLAEKCCIEKYILSLESGCEKESFYQEKKTENTVCNYFSTSVVLTLKWFCSPPPKDIWQCPETIWVVIAGDVGPASNEQGPQTLPSVLQCTGQVPTTKNYQAPNASSAEAERPCWPWLPPTRKYSRWHLYIHGFWVCETIRLYGLILKINKYRTTKK